MNSEDQFLENILRDRLSAAEFAEWQQRRAYWATQSQRPRRDPLLDLIEGGRYRSIEITGKIGWRQ
jgi:hypothetical protein